MTTCTKCQKVISGTYSCEHTDDNEYCKECYTELHYYIIEDENR